MEKLTNSVKLFGYNVIWFTYMYLLALWAVIIQIIKRRSLKAKQFSEVQFSSSKNVAVITGGSSGIGYCLAKALLLRKFRVIIASNNENEGQKTAESLRFYYGGSEVEWMKLDLMSRRSVDAFVDALNSRNIPVHLLVNNAGVMIAPFSLSEDGFESHWSVNHLNHFLLTRRLLHRLKQSAEGGHASRIVNVSSTVHFMGDVIFEDISAKRGYSSYFAYAQSKLAQVMFTRHLAKLLRENEIPVTVIAVHPGVVDTNLYKHCNPLSRVGKALFGKLFMLTAEEGAKIVLHACLSSSLDKVSGCYLENMDITGPSYLACDQVLCKNMWDFSNELLRLPSNKLYI